jgi:hypothetical protein
MQTERYESSFGRKHRQQKLAHHKIKVKAQLAIKKRTHPENDTNGTYGRAFRQG